MAGKFIDDLVFKVIADTKGAVEGLKKVGDKAQELNRHAKSSASGMEAMFGKVKIGAGIAAAALAFAGGMALKFGLDMAKAASQAEEENRKLALTLKNVTGATKETSDATITWISSLSAATGIAGSKLNPAMEALARSTRDVTSSQKLLGLALDVSAGTGNDLQSVSIALGEAYKGNYTMLTRLRTGISQATLDTKDFKKITAELAGIFDGQAELAASTFQGSLARMGIAFTQLKESLGTLLIPVFQLLVNIINNSLIPTLRNWLTYLQKNPEVFQKVISAVATGINWFKDFAKILLYVGDAGLQAVSLLARIVQGIGFLTGIKGMKDWGRETAEALLVMAKGLDTVGDALDKFDARKALKGIDISKIKLPTLDITGGITGGGAPSAGASLARDFNNAAKGILDAMRTIKTSFTSIVSFNFKKVIADLSLDPLVVSMRDAIDATKDYVTAQNDLLAKTKDSAKADLAYVKSMNDVTDAGKAKTAALKEAVDQAKDAAVQSAQSANDALQRIADAQRSFVDETVSRIKSLRDAFRQATQVSLGGIATSISDAKRNIATAKENLANAEKELLKAQEKFKTNATAQAYEGVILKTSLPIFEAEKAAVEKAKKDLAIALGEEKNPYAATAEELLKALKSAYDNAVALSKASGDLAALGFSQDFITQIIEAGPELGNELAQSILSADPKTQQAMMDIFNNIQQVSKHGVDQLSIDLNAGAIAAMEAFIKGLKTVEDPLDKLMKAIEDRIMQMVTTIQQAIAAILAQLAALANIPVTGMPGFVIQPGFENQTIIAAAEQAAAEAIAAAADADAALAESEAALADLMLAESLVALETSGADSYSALRAEATGVAGWRMGEERSMTGFNVTVNANTNADPYDIAMATAFAIKTKSDSTYMYGSGVSNR